MDFRLRQKRRRTYNEPGDAHELTFSCYPSLGDAASELSGSSGSRAAADSIGRLCILVRRHVAF
jgi:hypothetical protein